MIANIYPDSLMVLIDAKGNSLGTSNDHEQRFYLNRYMCDFDYSSDINYFIFSLRIYRFKADCLYSAVVQLSTPFLPVTLDF